MNTSNLRRLQNEIKNLKKNSESNEEMFHVEMINDNMYHWNILLHGPKDSLYHGYHFKLEMKLSSDYPFEPPSIKFLTPIQHVNINKQGDICLDILKSDKWAASQNIETVLISIRALLSDPNENDPFNSELAELYRENKKNYIKEIKKCCEQYAK